MKIYLLGLPSSGKSYVGKELAKKLDYKFYDINHLIELEALMYLDEIAENLGEETIRNTEVDLLNKILKEDNVVIALNSYFVKNKKNKHLLDGVKIYIDTDPKIIEKRLVNNYRSYDIINESLEELHKKMFLHYLSFAEVSINNNNELSKTIEDILTYIKII